MSRTAVSPRTRGPVRVVAAARAGWAGALILAPRRLLRAGGLSPATTAEVAAVRVLGVRHLLQAVFSAAVPTPAVAGLGAAVDTVHAGSCVVLAAATRRRRRVAALDAVVEAGFAAAGWACTDRP